MGANEQMIWKCSDKELDLTRPRVMGILNVTPDSFSDGGEHFSAEAAIERGMEMLDQGADIIDVGGESTRPGFTPVSPDEEARRILPVVKELAREGAIVSVDTRHVDVARACLRVGAAIINDVTGFADPKMVEAAVESGAGCVIMQAGSATRSESRKSVYLDTDPAAHRREVGGAEGDPTEEAEHAERAEQGPAEPPAEQGSAEQGKNLSGAADTLRDLMSGRSSSVSEAVARKGPGTRRYILPEEAPIMRGVMGYLGDRARELVRAGVPRESIAIDPGAGFGKSAEEDVIIQRATAKLASLGYPVVCALSRKRFVGAVGGGEVSDRDATSAGLALAACERGARIVRVHDVALMSQVLNGYWSAAHPIARRAFVALGSNVGDRMEYLAKACSLIAELPLTALTGVSRAYESEPAYGIATPVANAVVEVRTELAPMVLLEHLLAVEDELDRVRRPGEEGHGPRTIDCDLVWMENETHAGRKLTLPHKYLYERDFVLTPMADLQHDPERFLRNSGVKVVDKAQRIGRIISELGEIAWE